MTETRNIAIVRDYDEFLEALRARKNELDISDQTVDRITGFASGHTGKIFSHARVKNIGPTSFGLLLMALGVKIALVEDQQSMATLADLREGRKRPPFPAHRVSCALKDRVLPEIMRDLSILAIEARRQKISPFRRTQIARKAGLASAEKMRARRRKPRPVSAP